MENFENSSSGEDFAQLERITEFENELINQHREFLVETGHGIKLYPLPTPDFSEPSGIMNQVILQDIVDINLWVKPFFQVLPNVKQKLAYYITHPDQAVVQNLLNESTGNPANYYQNPFADKTLKKLVSIGHLSNSTNNQKANYSRTNFMFRTQEIKSEARISFVLNYLLNFKGEWTNDPSNSGSGFLIQRVSLQFSIKGIPSTVINPTPFLVHSERVNLYDFDSRITPLQQDQLSFGQNIGLKLQSLDFDAFKDHYFELEISLYTYASTLLGKSALQAELQLIETA